ncbi:MULTISPECIES: hypothetical protein [unclassified Spirillospora]|uniref:hypothetical protein n=1 Tax=unclassified Spirillospora TaxID=2642701 RepID=UPI00371B2753
MPETQNAYPERTGASAPSQTGSWETGGVEVRLGSRTRERERQRRERQGRERRERRPAGRRGMMAGAGVLVVAGLVVIGLVLTPGSGDEGEADAGKAGQSVENVELPPAGAPVEIGTADGFRYRIAAVTSGLNEKTKSAPPAGTSFPYIDYLLTNPTQQEVLLNFPGDVFLKREFVTSAAQGRCEPQTGVPDDMCTPPTTSEVVRRLAGGELVPAAGGDKYMPPGSTYLVRITVQAPIKRGLTRADMSLYVWRQLYMADKPAKQVPFPK